MVERLHVTKTIEISIGATSGGHATEDLSGKHIRMYTSTSTAKYWYSTGIGAAATAAVPSSFVDPVARPVVYEYIPNTNDEITSGSTAVGTKYKIMARQTADFTQEGAANNNVGTVFTATGVQALGTGDRLMRLADLKVIQGAAGTLYVDILQDYSAR